MTSGIATRRRTRDADARDATGRKRSMGPTRSICAPRGGYEIAACASTWTRSCTPPGYRGAALLRASSSLPPFTRCSGTRAGELRRETLLQAVDRVWIRPISKLACASSAARRRGITALRHASGTGLATRGTFFRGARRPQRHPHSDGVSPAVGTRTHLWPSRAPFLPRCILQMCRETSPPPDGALVPRRVRST